MKREIDIIQSTEEDGAVKEVVDLWRQGQKFDEDGYEDLGLTLQTNAMDKALKLGKELRLIIADILFPIK